MTERHDDGPDELLAELLQRARDAGLPLRETGARLDETGWSCQVVHAQGPDGRTWILRAARDQSTAQTFSVERATLDAIGSLGVHVPCWRPLGAGLVAYRRLEGWPAAVEDPTTLAFEWSLRSADRHRYARDLAVVVAKLHAMDPPMQVTVVTPDEARTHAMELLAAPEAGDVPDDWRRALDAWIGDDRSWMWTPRLLHGDLHPGHTLIVDHKLSAIIDWTDAVVDDPAREFVYLAWSDTPDDPILHEILRTYRQCIGWPDLDFDRRVDGYADLKVVELLVRGRCGAKDILVGAASQRLRSRPRLGGPS